MNSINSQIKRRAIKKIRSGHERPCEEISTTDVQDLSGKI